MSIRHYQLACAILAVTSVSSLAVAHQRGHQGRGLRATATSATRTAADRVRRPVRVSAAALGLSEAALIDELLAAPTAREVALYADKLGVVGTDDAVIALTPLADDPRAGVPEAVIAAIGHIGSRRATDVLLELLDDPRPRVRGAAVGALGSLADERAVVALIAIADDRADPTRLTAIWALGEQGGETATAHLVAIARSGDPAAATSAVAALAAIPTAQVALLALTDAADVRIRVAALGALDPSSPAAIARLTAVLAIGEPQTSQAAITALGRSGDAAVVPVLARAAREGSAYVMSSAVSALGEVGGPDAIAALGDLLAHGELDVTGQIATTLASIGDDGARAQLIAVAVAGGRRGSQVLAALGTLRGADVQAALLTIAQHGTAGARREALPLLLRDGVPQAMALATDLIASGTRTDRLAVIAMLGDAPGPEARATLLDLAGREHGPVRTAALDALSQTRPDDPELTSLLGDALLDGRPDEVTSAASILGRLGTADARALLVAAIGDDDPARAQAAIGALGYGVAITADLRAALAAVATGGPAGLRGQATQQLLSAGGPEGLAAARSLLTGGDPELARQTLWALASVGSDDADRAIREAVASTDAQVRATAAQVMAQRPDDADTALLIQLGRDGDPAVKAQALSTLGAIGSREAVDSLLATATSAGKDDRVAAINGLAAVDDPRAMASMARLIEDGDPEVAAAAIYAAGNGGDEVDQALVRTFAAAADGDPRRYAAATQLRQRGVAVDDATAKALDLLMGPAYGGGSYGGYGGQNYYEE